MKKLLALTLALCMALSACAALADEAGLKDARSYINLDAMTEEEIVEAAYGLDDGAALPTPTVLTGTIVAIPSPYSEDYDNITVNIQVGDLADKPIQCYCLTGGEDLAEGDIITVTGTIKNYNGTIEFDKGCTYVKGAPATEDEELAEAVAELQALLDNEGIDLDVNALLTDLMGLFDEAEGGEEKVVEEKPAEESGDELDQLFAELGQLLEGIADETKTGEESGESLGSLTDLLQLFGEQGEGETPEAEPQESSDAELEALVNELFNLFTKE